MLSTRVKAIAVFIAVPLILLLMGSGAIQTAYRTIQNSGTPVTQRTSLNMTGPGASCVDNTGTLTTDCTFSGSGGSWYMVPTSASGTAYSGTAVYVDGSAIPTAQLATPSHGQLFVLHADVANTGAVTISVNAGGNAYAARFNRQLATGVSPVFAGGEICAGCDDLFVFNAAASQWRQVQSPTAVGTGMTRTWLGGGLTYGLDATALATFAGLVSGGTPFTITGCSATVVAAGATVGSISSGTSGTCTAVITLNGATGLTAPNGWVCIPTNLTTANLIRQTASTTATCTVSGVTISGDVINILAGAY